MASLRSNESSRPSMLPRLGMVGAVVGAGAVYALLGFSSLDEPARRTAAVGVLMAILWMTEAIPLPATSLIPIALFPLLGVSSIRSATAPYAHELIFLFMGGFMLALAMEKWGLHKRFSLLIVLMVGVKPRRLIGGFMLAAAILSMWISNTATTIMMMPIGVSIITLVESHLRNDPALGHSSQKIIDRFGVCLMLGLAYAASIGGVATIIGTPPNIVLVGYLKDSFDITIGFGQWMLIGVPFSAIFLVSAWLLLTRVLQPVTLKEIPGGRELIRQELRALGPISRGEWTVFFVFIITASLWMGRQPLTHWDWLVGVAPIVKNLTDPGIAIAAALALFIIPVDLKKNTFALDWTTASKLPWGVLLLFGGGLSLAKGVSATGLDQWIGQQAQVAGALPTVVIVLLIVTMVIFLTELTSNTATTTTFLPILGGVAIGLSLKPTSLVIPATIAASCAFMMPVATPPNAIVFGTGRVTIGQMMRAGIVLNLIGIALITLLAFTAEKWALGGLL